MPSAPEPLTMTTSRRTLLVLCCAAPLAAPRLGAQNAETPAAKPAPSPERIELGNEGTTEKGPLTRERLSTLVDVLLTNEERVRGVVKNGRYVEVPKGIDFTPRPTVEVTRSKPDVCGVDPSRRSREGDGWTAVIVMRALRSKRTSLHQARPADGRSHWTDLTCGSAPAWRFGTTVM